MRSILLVLAVCMMPGPAHVHAQGTGSGSCYFGACADGPRDTTAPGLDRRTPNPGPRAYHFVDDTRPPDAFLALRTAPSASAGGRIMEMANGTLLEVIEQRSDGWWKVRVVESGHVGWALNRQGSRIWIHCCRTQ